MSERFVKLLYPDGTEMFSAPIGDEWEMDGQPELVENPPAEGDPRGPLAGRGPDLVIRLKKSTQPQFEIVEGEGPVPMAPGGVPKEDLLGMSTTDLQSKSRARLRPSRRSRAWAPSARSCPRASTPTRTTGRRLPGSRRGSRPGSPRASPPGRPPRSGRLSRRSSRNGSGATSGHGIRRSRADGRRSTARR
jgi:hypothetical protein